MIGKWEEGKKWQKRVETLKAQCRDKDAEIEKLKKNNDMLRHAVDRLHVELQIIFILSAILHHF